MKKRFSSDSDDDVIPKCVFDNPHSTDSGILSYSEAIALPKYGQYSEVDNPGIYSLATHSFEAGLYIENSSVSDIYVDAISSHAHVNILYNNMPRPERILDDSYANYSEPDEFPPGYKQAHLLGQKHSAHQQNLVKVSNYLSDEPVYIDIESLPLQMQEPGNGRALYNSAENNATSPPTSPAQNGQLLASTGTEPPNDNILTAFSDHPDSFAGYQPLPDIELLNGSLDSSHDYQPLRFKSSDKEREIFV